MGNIMYGEFKQSKCYGITYKGELVVLEMKARPTKLFKTLKMAQREYDDHMESFKRNIKYAGNKETMESVKKYIQFLKECKVEELHDIY